MNSENILKKNIQKANTSPPPTLSATLKAEDPTGQSQKKYKVIQ